MPRQSPETWEKIKAEWEAGQLDVSVIAKAHGVSAPAIFKRAAKEAWPPRPTQTDVVTTLVTTLHETEQVVTNPRAALMTFERAIRLLREHREDISTLRLAMRACADRIEKMVGEKAGKQGWTLKSETMVMGALRDYANALARVVPLERRAFGFTDEDGVSELDGMTEEELAAVEAQFRKALGR